jgi:hypothetical protein
MIAAVHLGVTVQAVAAEQKRARVCGGQAVTVLQLTGVERRRVALLAQEWPTGGQQPVVHGTVGTVTQAAILGCGRVFEQERPALLGVAGVAGVVERRFDQRRFGGRTMRIVAVDAGGSAFEDWMSRTQPNRCADVRVALEADL